MKTLFENISEKCRPEIKSMKMYSFKPHKLEIPTEDEIITVMAESLEEAATNNPKVLDMYIHEIRKTI